MVRVHEELLQIGRCAVVVDGLETVGLGGMIGESAFLSGQKRACDIRCKATSGADLAGPADEHTSVLLLVVSRIGFQKAMKVAPEVAVKFLWNVAHELSVRFTARNELFKATALELKASKASADFEVSKLLKLVAIAVKGVHDAATRSLPAPLRTNGCKVAIRVAVVQEQGQA